MKRQAESQKTPTLEITQYGIYDDVITVMRRGKTAVAFKNNNQLFNNFGSGENFDKWWETYNEYRQLKPLPKSKQGKSWKELIARKKLLFR